jgi:DNA-binding transcriptional regulator YiaG
VKLVPNIGAILKSEISRISRRETRQEIQAIRKASVTYRHEIAALKRHVHELRQQLSRLGKQTAAPRDAGGDPPARPSRFVAKGLRSLRTRLGLSAPELARLIGVSTQSVYNWETKKSVPRPQQLAALAPLRALGKREVRRRMEELDSKSRKK